MIEPLTPNTQAILLLTAPLVAGRNETSCDLLSLGEYNKLTRILRERQKQPADLIGSDARDLLELCAQCFGRERLEFLLGRGFLLSQAVERWNTRAIWVMSRADSSYPRRLKSRLKEDAPPLLYGCGEVNLLEKGGLAVVGSRHVDDELITFAENVGRLAAKAHRPILSGGAKGIDRAAMHGALLEGGDVAGVMADSLERAALARDNLEPLMDGRLVLISPYDPAAGFNVGHAMQRNKVIYALSDAGLVVTSDFEKGGTWAGAIEQLKRLHLVPVFVRNEATARGGNPALIQQGGLPWPNPENPSELGRTLLKAAESVPKQPKQEFLPLALKEEPPSTAYSEPSNQLNGADATAESATTPAEELFRTVGKVLQQELKTAKTEAEVMILLGITKSQAKEWLVKLVNDGVVEKVKKTKPVQYRTSTSFDLRI
jgi:predicted Rossmann fold nucleotide-binding protein DprA/Smf involved in DNA uptake